MADNDLDAPLGHAAMAEELFKQFGEVIRWVPDLRKGQLVYFDARWHGEEGCHARVEGMLSRAINKRARALKLPPKPFKAMTSIGFHRGAIAMLIQEYEEKLHRPLRQWDKDPDVLQTPKHVWDLEHGTCWVTRPEDFHLKCTAYEPDATILTPLHVKLLDNCFLGSPEDRLFFEDCIGGALRGINPGQKFCWLIGTQGCGKSTELMVARHVLGDYAELGETAIVVTPTNGVYNDSSGFALADLAEKRLVIFDEAPLAGRINGPVFKKLANGFQQRINGKYETRRTGQFYCTPFLVTNRLIEDGLKGEDGGSARRRIAMIRAAGPEVPASQRQDELLRQILETEGPGVLAWYIEQARLHYERRGVFGPGAPKGSDIAETLVEEFTTTTGEHAVAEWVEEVLSATGDQNEFIPLGVMWEAFGRWWPASDEGQATGLLHPPMGRGNFYDRLHSVLAGKAGVSRRKGPPRTGNLRNFVDGYRGVIGL